MLTLEERHRPPGPECRSTNLKRLNKFHFLVFNLFYEDMISSEMQFKMAASAIYILLRAVISNECTKLIVFQYSEKHNIALPLELQVKKIWAQNICY